MGLPIDVSGSLSVNISAEEVQQVLARAQADSLAEYIASAPELEIPSTSTPPVQPSTSQPSTSQPQQPQPQPQPQPSPQEEEATQYIRSNLLHLQTACAQELPSDWIALPSADPSLPDALLHLTTNSLLYPRTVGLPSDKFNACPDDVIISAAPVHVAVTGVQILPSLGPEDHRTFATLDCEGHTALRFRLNQAGHPLWHAEGEVMLPADLSGRFRLSLGSPALGEHAVVAEKHFSVRELFAQPLVIADEDIEALERCTSLGVFHRTRWFEVGSPDSFAHVRLRITLSYGTLASTYNLNNNNNSESVEANPSVSDLPTPVSKENDPRWAPDSPSCARCAASFGLLLRRHHCRSCGQVFCHDCSSFKVHLDTVSGPLRVCSPCLRRIEASPAELWTAVEPFTTWLPALASEPSSGTGWFLSYADTDRANHFRVQQCPMSSYRVVFIDPRMPGNVIPLATMPDLTVATRVRRLLILSLGLHTGAIYQAQEVYQRILDNMSQPVWRTLFGEDPFSYFRTAARLRPPAFSQQCILAAQAGYYYTRDTIVPTVHDYVIVPVFTCAKWCLKAAWFLTKLAVKIGVTAVVVTTTALALSAGFAMCFVSGSALGAIGGVLGALVVAIMAELFVNWLWDGKISCMDMVRTTLLVADLQSHHSYRYHRIH